MLAGTASQADALVPPLLEFADQPRTNADMERRLAEAHDTHGRAWWAIRTYGPLWHAPTGGPWSFGPRPSYVAARSAPFDGDRAAALRHLGRRYLEGFGPASLRDLSQFALIYRPLAREALETQADSLVRIEGPGGTELFDVPGATLPDEDAPAPPRLLGMWDSALLAYADRSRIVPPDYRRLVSQSNGDLLPTVLVDGYVAGVWRPVDEGIEVTAFEKLPANAWQGIETEAAGLLGFLADRDPKLYRRYGRWWAGLPSADVRIVGR